jgi:hypothetical protein
MDPRLAPSSLTAFLSPTVQYFYSFCTTVYFVECEKYHSDGTCLHSQLTDSMNIFSPGRYPAMFLEQPPLCPMKILMRGDT